MAASGTASPNPLRAQLISTLPPSFVVYFSLVLASTARVAIFENAVTSAVAFKRTALLYPAMSLDWRRSLKNTLIPRPRRVLLLVTSFARYAEFERHAIINFWNWRFDITWFLSNYCDRNNNNKLFLRL